MHHWPYVIDAQGNCKRIEELVTNMGNVMFCTGWDERSALLRALVDGKWQQYGLPKASHAFEQVWQTEWMRIRRWKPNTT